jgi:hypothetical protein
MGIGRLPAHIPAIKETDHVSLVDGCHPMGGRYRTATSHRWTISKRARHARLNNVQRSIDKRERSWRRHNRLVTAQ